MKEVNELMNVSSRVLTSLCSALLLSLVMSSAQAGFGSFGGGVIDAETGGVVLTKPSTTKPPADCIADQCSTGELGSYSAINPDLYDPGAQLSGGVGTFQDPDANTVFGTKSLKDSNGMMSKRAADIKAAEARGDTRAKTASSIVNYSAQNTPSSGNTTTTPSGTTTQGTLGTIGTIQNALGTINSSP